jgi:membrane fusion protein (multidrug efflux system)
MFADAKLKFARPQTVITVPPTAIVTTQEKRFVIRVKEGITEWVDVSQGTGVGEKVEVFGNLSQGDQIVKTGNEELKADTKVVVKLPK